MVIYGASDDMMISQWHDVTSHLTRQCDCSLAYLLRSQPNPCAWAATSPVVAGDGWQRQVAMEAGQSKRRGWRSLSSGAPWAPAAGEASVTRNHLVRLFWRASPSLQWPPSLEDVRSIRSHWPARSHARDRTARVQSVWESRREMRWDS
jgi:hypothetical protein